MSEHKLKCWPGYFDAVLSGEKKFEARKNDRGFLVGDKLVLQEWCPTLQEYTGRETTRAVSYILHGGNWGIEPGHAILALADDATPSNPINLADFEGMTPGPWTFRHSNVGLVVLMSDNETSLANVGKYRTEQPELEANARAIAAVPDLIAEVARQRADIERLTRECEALDRLLGDQTASSMKLAKLERDALARLATLEAQVAEMKEERDVMASALTELMDCLDKGIDPRDCDGEFGSGTSPKSRARKALAATAKGEQG